MSNQDASSLTLRWTAGLSHILHVRDKDTTAVNRLENARSVSSSRSTRSFQVPDWTLLGSRIDQTRLQLRLQEGKVFQKLREEVLKNILRLRRYARLLDELDVACGLSTLAFEQKLVRPILDKTTSHTIIAGRHPVVESSLRASGRMFTPNDCTVGAEHRLWLLTGPNMGGKSTFLRQNALISILAQMGSFVPADFARLGIVDQIFSRVGYADDLFKNQSTFMVEMLETATILKSATPRSLVIMDEVGRGTTFLDGLAIAYACIHHLHSVSRCRVIFATHFHELGQMIGSLPQAGPYRTDLSEQADGSFTFEHKVRRGVNPKSHGIKVAELAGLPSSTIDTAKSVLSYLEQSASPVDMRQYHTA